MQPYWMRHYRKKRSISFMAGVVFAIILLTGFVGGLVWRDSQEYRQGGK